MNRIFRYVSLPVVAAFLVACCLTAMAAEPGAGRRVVFGDSARLDAAFRPLPASFSTRVEQAATQDDPTGVDPVLFEVTFDTAIVPASFTDADLVQNGSATVGVWNIVDSGNHRNFFVAADGLTAGTVIPTVLPGEVFDDDDNTNQGSVSVDNSVTFGPVACATFTYLYAAVWSPPRIYVYCVENDGSLTYQSTVDAPGDVRDMQVAADGLSLYYADAHLTRYTLSTDGSIVEAGSNVVGNGSYDDLVLHPGGRYLYGTHSTNGGTVFAYDTEPVTTVPPQIDSVSNFYIPHGLAIDPSGDYIYIANYYDIFNPEKIVSFALRNNGTFNLSNFGVSDFTARAMYFAIHPTKDSLYWTETSGGSVITGSRAGVSVSLEDSDFSGWGARPLTIDEDGSHVYVANNNNDDIGVFEVAGNGDLMGQALRPTARRPEHLLLHPNGDFLYVASAGDGWGPSTLSIYQVLGNGDLFELTPEEIADQGAYRLAIVDLAAP